MDNSRSTTRILSRQQLAAEKGITACNLTLIRWEKTNAFPKRFYLTRKTPVWLETAVDAWLLQKQAECSNTITEKATEGRRKRRAGVAP